MIGTLAVVELVGAFIVDDGEDFVGVIAGKVRVGRGYRVFEDGRWIRMLTNRMVGIIGKVGKVGKIGKNEKIGKSWNN